MGDALRCAAGGAGCSIFHPSFAKGNTRHRSEKRDRDSEPPGGSENRGLKHALMPRRISSTGSELFIVDKATRTGRFSGTFTIGARSPSPSTLPPRTSRLGRLKRTAEARAPAPDPRRCIPRARRPSPGRRVSKMTTTPDRGSAQPSLAPPSSRAAGIPSLASPRPASVSSPPPLREPQELSYSLSSPCSRSPPGREYVRSWPFWSLAFPARPRNGLSVLSID